MAKTEPIPERPFQILDNYCLGCHDEVEFKGEINLDTQTIDWNDSEEIHLWERVIKMVEKGEMPPKKKKQPTQAERNDLAAWLDTNLSQHQPIGGSEIRRLNRREYQHTISQLFGIHFELPNGFPQDNEAHGFDNQAEALTLSGALMESYSTVATDLAEKLFPPLKKEVPANTFDIPAQDFTYAYSSGLLVDGAMRLVSSTETLGHGSTWPTHYEAPATGTYKITLNLSSLNPWDGVPVVADIYAVVATEASQENINQLRKLASYEITESSGQAFETEVVLEKGETIAFHYPTAVIKEDSEKLKSFLYPLFEREPALAAAYRKVGGPVSRGRSGLDHLYELIKLGELPTPPEGEELDALIEKIVKDQRMIAETFSYKLFEEGPALEIRHATITGPLTLTDTEEELYWQERAAHLMGNAFVKDEESDIRAFLKQFLTAAFRRPASNQIVEEYLSLVLNEKNTSGRMEDGYHLAIRTALTSPYFLYRGFDDGQLDGFDLATRLSYFLTSRPPDKALIKAAEDGSLSETDVLTEQTRRLMASSQSNTFVDSFLGQWLDLDELENLVPDANLFESPKDFKYTDTEKEAYIQEAHMVFKEILEENRPLEDFIDPDFTYTTGAVARYIYGLPEFNKSKKNDNKKMVRVALEQGGRFGGLLGMAGVMTATANGVDTQPVLRGVWVLENILGDPPPPPPNAVPALTPGSGDAVSPRDILAAHMAEESCAGCHKKIDPVGFVLESFDPVGRWRTEYPSQRTSNKKEKAIGLPVETDGRLTDGTVLNDITDLKAYLRNDITPFAECISEKLLTYATGREMNYSDRKLIRELVRENLDRQGGFQDLFVALVNSESFRTK
ncbi:MAG: DUF1592 domain-containing protein [Verrucomicrobia bacterium]|nr:DUF1592 domain-containing protein [Verrucomicrobiota bacterium]MDA1066891.1 DUF1592 domain-containing protein [Verrucomicrobiota bacterium]